MGILDAVSELAGSVADGVGSAGSGALNFAEEKARQVANMGVAIGDAATSGARGLASGVSSLGEDAKRFAQSVGARVQGIVGEGLKLAQDVMDDPGGMVDRVVEEARTQVTTARNTALETVHSLEHSADEEVREVAHSVGAFGGDIVRAMARGVANEAEFGLSKVYIELQHSLSIARQAALIASKAVGTAGVVARTLALLAMNQMRLAGIRAIQRAADRMTQKVNRISQNLLQRAANIANNINARVGRIVARVTMVATGAANLVSGAIGLANSLIQKVLAVVSAILPAGIVARAQAAVAQFTAWTASIAAQGQRIAARVREFAQEIAGTVQGITGGLLGLFTEVDLIAADAAKAEIHELEAASESRLNAFMNRLIVRVQVKIATFVNRIQQHLIRVYARLSKFSASIAFPAVQIIINVGKIIRGAGDIAGDMVEGEGDLIGDMVGGAIDPNGSHPPVVGPLQRGLAGVKRAGLDPAGLAPSGLGPVGQLLRHPIDTTMNAGRTIAGMVGRGVVQGVNVGMGIIDAVGGLLGHPIDSAINTGRQIVETVRPVVNGVIDGAIGVVTGTARGIGNLIGSGVQAGERFAQGVASGTQRLLDRVTQVGLTARPNDGDLTGVFLPGNPLPQEGDVPRLHGTSTPSARDAAIAGGAAIFVNGINTKLSEHYSAAQRFANELNTPVVGVYNASAGMVQDILQCVSDKMFDRSRNPAIATMTRLIRNYGDARQHNGGLRIFAHSQGSLIVSEALRQAQGGGADLSRNDVTTFGNAAYTMPAGPQYHNYVHDDDLVSGLTGSGSGISYLMNQTGVGRFLSGQALGPTVDVQSHTVTLHHGGSMIDPHSINSPDGHDYIGDYSRFRAAEARGETGTSSMHNTGAFGFAIARGIGSSISDAVSSRYNRFDRGVRGAAGGGLGGAAWGGLDSGMRAIGGGIQNWGEGWGRERDAAAPGAPGVSAGAGATSGGSWFSGLARALQGAQTGGLSRSLGIGGLGSGIAGGMSGIGTGRPSGPGSFLGGGGFGSFPFAPWMSPSTLASPDGQVLQRSPIRANADDVDPGQLRQHLLQSGGAGMPVPGAVMERFNEVAPGNVEGARLHADPRSATAARDIGARAFTIGSDVFFGAGQFEPHTTQGVALIGHELTHVVQQREGRVQPAREGSSPSGDAAEREAQGTERRLLMGVGRRDSLYVNLYSRTYQAHGLQQREQERLDELSMQAIQEAERIVRRENIPNAQLDVVNVDLAVNLQEMSDAEIVDRWSTAILSAVRAQLVSTAREIAPPRQLVQRLPDPAPAAPPTGRPPTSGATPSTDPAAPATAAPPTEDHYSVQVDEHGAATVLTRAEYEQYVRGRVRYLRSMFRYYTEWPLEAQRDERAWMDQNHGGTDPDQWWHSGGGLVASISDMYGGVVPPSLSRWSFPSNMSARGTQMVTDLEAAVNAWNVPLFQAMLRNAMRNLETVKREYESCRHEWTAYINGTISGAESAVSDLTFVRDTSFTIAVACAVIVAAPAALAVGGAAATGVGATGTAATVVAWGTAGTIVTAGGAVSVGTVRGTTSAAGSLLATGHVDTAQAWADTREGAMRGGIDAASTFATLGLGLATGAGATVFNTWLRRAGIEGLVGLITGALNQALAEFGPNASPESVNDTLTNRVERIVVASILSGATSAVSGGLTRRFSPGGSTLTRRLMVSAGTGTVLTAITSAIQSGVQSIQTGAAFDWHGWIRGIIGAAVGATLQGAAMPPRAPGTTGPIRDAAGQIVTGQEHYGAQLQAESERQTASRSPTPPAPAPPTPPATTPATTTASATTTTVDPAASTAHAPTPAATPSPTIAEPTATTATPRIAPVEPATPTEPAAHVVATPPADPTALAEPAATPATHPAEGATPAPTEPGVESLGTRPDPATRQTTREEYQQQQSEARRQERALARTRLGLPADDEVPVPPAATTHTEPTPEQEARVETLRDRVRQLRAQREQMLDESPESAAEARALGRQLGAADAEAAAAARDLAQLESQLGLMSGGEVAARIRAARTDTEVLSAVQEAGGWGRLGDMNLPPEVAQRILDIRRARVMSVAQRIARRFGVTIHDGERPTAVFGPRAPGDEVNVRTSSKISSDIDLSVQGERFAEARAALQQELNAEFGGDAARNVMVSTFLDAEMQPVHGATAQAAQNHAGEVEGIRRLLQGAETSDPVQREAFFATQEADVHRRAAERIAASRAAGDEAGATAAQQRLAQIEALIVEAREAESRRSTLVTSAGGPEQARIAAEQRLQQLLARRAALPGGVDALPAAQRDAINSQINAALQDTMMLTPEAYSTHGSRRFPLASREAASLVGADSSSTLQSALSETSFFLDYTTGQGTVQERASHAAKYVARHINELQSLIDAGQYESLRQAARAIKDEPSEAGRLRILMETMHTGSGQDAAQRFLAETNRLMVELNSRALLEPPTTAGTQPMPRGTSFGGGPTSSVLSGGRSVPSTSAEGQSALHPGDTPREP